jgi:branched-chain amino acid transport system ATP-binding protein
VEAAVTPASFSARGLLKRYGGLLVTNDVSLDLHAGEVHAVIGPNGAGKSTLVHLVSGLVRPDAGQIELQGREITRLPPHQRAALGLGRCFQITSIFGASTVRDNLRLALQCHRGSSFRFFRRRDAEPGLDAAAAALAERVGLERDLEVVAGALAHGAQRRLDLALALAGEPKILLLDEPMAGLGPDESQQLVQLIDRLRRHAAILLVEHDMDAVFRLADRVTVLVEGKVFAQGTPQEVRSDRRVQAVYLGSEAAT